MADDVLRLVWQLGDDLQRLLLAVALAACIGWEREWRRKPAGLRTHMVVALGSAAFVLVAVRLAEHAALAVDPSRVVQGVVGGIGFLGAGTILQHRGGVEGLTTAATLWLTAAVGVAAAIGAPALALSVTMIALAALLVIGPLERRAQSGGAPTPVANRHRARPAGAAPDAGQ